MFAIISFKNGQHKVSEGDTVKLPMTSYDEKDKKIVFENVLLISDGENVLIGAPFVEGARVEGEILGTEKSKKVRVFKFRAKKRYKRTAGSKSEYLKVQIKKIEAK